MRLFKKRNIIYKKPVKLIVRLNEELKELKEYVKDLKDTSDCIRNSLKKAKKRLEREIEEIKKRIKNNADADVDADLDFDIEKLKNSQPIIRVIGMFKTGLEKNKVELKTLKKCIEVKEKEFSDLGLNNSR